MIIDKTPVTYVFLYLCLLITVPSVFSSRYYEMFSGELPHENWWQNLTMAFQHGKANNPEATLGHLLLNTILLLTCGRMIEQLLGSKRFLLVSIAAWIGFVATQWISGIWINGSSGIIWAYSPFLLFYIQRDVTEAQQAKGLMIIMWVVVTIAMGFVPLLFNPTHSLLYTFFYGNLFHAAATVIGFLFYFLWKDKLTDS
jgi:membrane associated rhomboid family serine protease